MSLQKIKILVVLLFLIYLPYASSEEFSYAGPLPSPGPLVLPSDAASDANASGRAIVASIETAAMMMGGIESETASIDYNPETGIIKSGPVPIDAASHFSVKSEPMPSATAWTSLGGYTAYKHSAIMDNQGRRHVFIIGGDLALWDNVDGSWVYIGGNIRSTPYPAKDKFGRIHLVVLGADYSLWDFIFDTSSWTGTWRGLGGYLSSMATAAMEPTYGNYMKIVARGGDNSLWYWDFNVNDLSSYNILGLGGNLKSKPFVIFDSNSRIHILARGGDNGLWDNRGVLSSGSYVHNWHGLGGTITETPFATLEPGWPSTIAAMVRGTDNALWMADINVLSNPETCTWYRLGGAISSDAFAATDSANRIHTFARGSDGGMWENVFSSSPWNPSGAHWIGHGGFIFSPQALISGSQTYAYVSGEDDAIWRKIYATLSAPAASSEVEAFGKSDSPAQSEGIVAGGTGASIPMS